MGATYTRQSSAGIVDGGVIEATDLNNEFDQLLAAFVAASGHTHDGTAAEGGPVTKLLGTSLTIGDGTAGTDIAVTFDGESNDGTLTWMEDEDLFKFSNAINVGVDDAGHDVKFFGDTASAYMLWDTSADDLILAGAAGLVIPDAGNIGSASDTDAVAISSAGVVALSATTEASATGTAALTLAGGLGVAKDVWIGDDLVLDSDSTVLKFGDDQDTTLTHTDGTGLTLNSTNKLTFGDVATYINQSSDGIMTVAGEATIDLTASTAVLVSNDLKLDSDSSVIGFGADNDTTLTHTDGTGLTLNGTNKLCFYDTALSIHSSTDGQLDLIADTEIQIAATTIDINGAVAMDGAITGATDITLSGELDAATLDISGNADIDGTANLDVVDIDGAVDMASTLQVDGAITSSAGATITTADNLAQLTLVSTDADSSSGPRLSLKRESGSPANNDYLGNIQFQMKNDAAESMDAVSITSQLLDVTDGSEDAQIKFWVRTAGTMVDRFLITRTETVFNDDSIDSDFRVETNAEGNAFKIDAGAETAAFGVPVTFNDAANVAQVALTSSSNAVAWDASAAANAYHLTTENTTIAAPTNAVEGAFICLEINHDGTTTVGWNTIFEFAASTEPTTTDTNAKTDIFVFRYNGAIWQEVGRTLNLSES